MTRGLPSALDTEFQGKKIFGADLIELHLSTPRYLTTSNINLDFDSATAPDSGTNTYLAQGQFIQYSNITESSDLRINQLIMDFTAVDTTTLALLLNNDYINTRVVIYRALLDEDYGFTSDDVFTLFDGKITGYQIREENDTAIVSVVVASMFADFERLNGRKTNPASQNIHFPNDKGFQYSAAIIKDMKWGRS
tara:strand:- start:973 stop:1554 length:582 start_codon:yes stop_codon:yes gene_type:complete